MAAGMGGPRQSTFKKGQRGASQSPDDMRVPDKVAYRADPMGGGPTVAPNDNAGRLDDAFKKRKRPLFTQSYWRQSQPHPDYLQGNPDARRQIGGDY